MKNSLLKRFIRESIENLNVNESANEIIKYLHYILEEDYTKTNLFRILLDLSVSETNKEWNNFEDKKIDLIDYIISALEIFEGERGITEMDIEKFNKKVYDKVNDFFNDMFEIIVEHGKLEEKEKHLMIIEFVENVMNYYRINFMKKHVGDTRVEKYIGDEDPVQKIINALKVSNSYDENAKKLVDYAKEEYDLKVSGGTSTIKAQKEMEEYLKLFYEFD